jgi:hypothetical protein
MMHLASGVAHLSFPGGGLFLPARDPYDRQVLVEHVASRVRRSGQVQVLIGSQRWVVQLGRGPSMAPCPRCGYAMDALCHLTGSGGVVYCVPCAFTGDRTSRLRDAVKRSAVS